MQAFVASVQDKAYDAGILKIIPPKGWWRSSAEVARLCDPVTSDFASCRVPRVSQLVSGHSGIFEVNHLVQKPVTVKDLYDKRGCPPLEQSRSLRGSSGSRFERVERRFWQSLTSDDDAWYGADVENCSVFKRLGGDGCRKWFLDDLPEEPLRQSLNASLGGVTESMIYVGTWRALFAWHLEDANLYSINLVHFGAPKSWYGISPRDAQRFEAFAADVFPGARNECPAFLRHKTAIISPKKLRDAGFRVSECVQEAGEIMITLPEAYHSGFNHGFNVAESTNFASRSWIDAGRRATVCCCQPGAVRIDIDAVARSICGEHDQDDASVVDEEGEVVDVQDGWARLHVNGKRRDSDVWVKLSSQKRKCDASKQETTNKQPRRRGRCGDCEGCKAQACGECKFCKDAPSRGGPGKLKKYVPLSYFTSLVFKTQTLPSTTLPCDLGLMSFFII